MWKLIRKTRERKKDGGCGVKRKVREEKRGLVGMNWYGMKRKERLWKVFCDRVFCDCFRNDVGREGRRGKRDWCKSTPIAFLFRY